MTSHVYVNWNQNTAVRIPIPSGGYLDLPQGHAVVGAYFERLAQVGILHPLEGCPPGFRPAKVHDPVAAEARRKREESSVSDENTLKELKPEDAFRDGESPLKAIAAIDATAAAPVQETPVVEAQTSSPDLFQERDKATWINWLTTTAETTVTTQLKSQDLKDLAQFLGCVISDSGTKMEVLAMMKQALGIAQA